MIFINILLQNKDKDVLSALLEAEKRENTELMQKLTQKQDADHTNDMKVKLKKNKINVVNTSY